jgi:hypothetical protein
MDSSTLVENQIDDGKRLIDELARHGFDVTTAFWLHATDDERWSFYIVSPVVDSESLTQAYRQIHPVVWAMPQLCWIDPLAVKLIGPSDPIAKDVLAILGRTPAHQVWPSRWRGKRLGNLSIDGAYLYPPPVPTPT